MMIIGTRVRPSTYAVEPKRIAWLREGGSRKESLKRTWQEAAAHLGTVTESSNGGVSVKWDDGRESSCLDYMVAEVKATVAGPVPS